MRSITVDGAIGFRGTDETRFLYRSPHHRYCGMGDERTYQYLHLLIAVAGCTWQVAKHSNSELPELAWHTVEQHGACHQCPTR